MRPSPSYQRPRISVQSVAAKMALAIIGLSLLYALIPGMRVLLPLVPGAVLGAFYVWQPVTYVFLANDPLGVLFGALITWSIGGALEATWGARRLLFFALGSTIASGLITVLLAFLWPPLSEHGFFGATVLTGALWVAYGLSYGRMQTNFWGLPVTGNQFALIGVGFVVLNGAFGGWTGQVPSLIALLLAWSYVRGFRPRMHWLRFQNWRLRRAMRSRTKHLHVISPNRNMPKDSDQYRH